MRERHKNRKHANKTHTFHCYKSKTSSGETHCILFQLWLHVISPAHKSTRQTHEIKAIHNWQHIPFSGWHMHTRPQAPSTSVKTSVNRDKRTRHTRTTRKADIQLFLYVCLIQPISTRTRVQVDQKRTKNTRQERRNVMTRHAYPSRQERFVIITHHTLTSTSLATFKATLNHHHSHAPHSLLHSVRSASQLPHSSANSLALCTRQNTSLWIKATRKHNTQNQKQQKWRVTIQIRIQSTTRKTWQAKGGRAWQGTTTRAPSKLRYFFVISHFCPLRKIEGTPEMGCLPLWILVTSGDCV